MPVSLSRYVRSSRGPWEQAALCEQNGLWASAEKREMVWDHCFAELCILSLGVKDLKCVYTDKVFTSEGKKSSSLSSADL